MIKRTVLLLVAASVALTAFADSDEDRVLEEARARAARNRTAREREERIEESRRKSEEKDAIYLPLAVSILPGPPIFGIDVDASVGVGLIISMLNNVYGAQVSYIGNIAEGDVFGIQSASVFNIANKYFSGAQLAGVFNIAGDGGGPIQLAGVFNIADGDFSGAQGAGVFNIAGGTVAGAQGAGVFNIAEDLRGFQYAGVFNIAENVRGVQAAGIFNVAKEVRGFQIGLVNISDTMYGIPIGLVNIVRNGILDTGVWFEDSGWAYGFLQRGSTNMYSILYAGAPQENWFASAEEFAAGAGFGVRFGGYRGRAPSLDIDLSAKAEIDFAAMEAAWGSKTDYAPSFFPSLRASVRVPLLLGIAAHVGVVLDTEIGGGPRVPDTFRESDSWKTTTFGLDWTFHPKFFLGFSL